MVKKLLLVVTFSACLCVQDTLAQAPPTIVQMRLMAEILKISIRTLTTTRTLLESARMAGALSALDVSTALASDYALERVLEQLLASSDPELQGLLRKLDEEIISKISEDEPWSDALFPPEIATPYSFSAYDLIRKHAIDLIKKRDREKMPNNLLEIAATKPLNAARTEEEIRRDIQLVLRIQHALFIDIFFAELQSRTYSYDNTDLVLLAEKAKRHLSQVLKEGVGAILGEGSMDCVQRWDSKRSEQIETMLRIVMGVTQEAKSYPEARAQILDTMEKLLNVSEADARHRLGRMDKWKLHTSD